MGNTIGSTTAITFSEEDKHLFEEKKALGAQLELSDAKNLYSSCMTDTINTLERLLRTKRNTNDMYTVDTMDDYIDLNSEQYQAAIEFQTKNFIIDVLLFNGFSNMDEIPIATLDEITKYVEDYKQSVVAEPLETFGAGLAENLPASYDGGDGAMFD